MNSDPSSSTMRVGVRDPQTHMFAKIERRLSRYLWRNPVRLAPSTASVSFTFDDVPHSACTVGREIMERHGCRATYYVAGGFTDMPSERGSMHSRHDIVTLMRAGHEIASHGFAHVDYQTLRRSEIVADLEENRRFLEGLGVDTTSLNFAYPYGCASPAAKSILRHESNSARVASGGPSKRTADLNGLQSVGLFQHEWTAQTITDAIQKNYERGGWLVFFIHEVVPNPGTFDCTPELLDSAVLAAVNSGAAVLPVSQVLERIRCRPTR